MAAILPIDAARVERKTATLRPMRHHSDLTGILVLDKDLGMSSMRAVEIARRRAGRAKAGHAGTLDPLATGVLVVAFGRATKAIDLLMATEKRYETDVDLSAFTATDDREGERREVVVATPPTSEAVERALGGFLGEIMQKPPAFSAVHVGGKRAYALARNDAPPDLPPRRVVVHEIALLRYEWPIATVAIRSGKGFYVRSLARDLGLALGTGGHCATLRRTAVGPFTLKVARTLADLPEHIDESCVIPLETALGAMGALTSRVPPTPLPPASPPGAPGHPRGS
jgi:tRNA pseudouridine55 synthase